MKLSGARKAFTLAELLMAILVISIIMVALAPVITRRAYDNVSIEVNKKKGLEIYTNPGTYTFDVPIGINTLFLQGSGGGGGGAGATYIDKEVSFNTNTTWTVPKGVSQLTFTLYGSGGGGGAGYYISKSDEYGGCQSGSQKIAYMAENGQDLCVTHVAPLNTTIGKQGRLMFVKKGETCTGSCCWVGPLYNYNGCKTSIWSSDGCGGVVHCNRDAISDLCQQGKSFNSAYPFVGVNYENRKITEPRFISDSELRRIIDQYPTLLGPNGLDYCWGAYTGASSDGVPPINLTVCAGMKSECTGSGNGYCYNYGINTNGGYIHSQSFSGKIQTGTPPAYPITCVRNLVSRELRAGAGGSSGAKITRTINVLPNDTFTITIGSGGEGGIPNGGSGKQGGTTQIIHKRGGTELGTYYIKGGFGGQGASSTKDGVAAIQGTGTNQTTPNGTCYIRYRKNTADSFTGGNTSCDDISYPGTSGFSTMLYNIKNNLSYAGDGGLFANKGSRAKGATLDSGQDNILGQGFNAVSEGNGGGGGFCGRGKTSCAKGGKGGSGRIDIQYRIMLPGSGGGSAARVGGSKVIADTETLYEIRYKVKEGSRLVFKIGSGGTGGAVGQNGLNGSATVIGNEEIIFLAGQGGFSLTQAQKNNLSSCIGSTTSSSTILGCLNTASYKPVAGVTSAIDQDNNIKTTTLGLIINNSNVSFTIANSSYKGNDGKTSSMVNTSSIVPWSYGFDGGIGGAPFGINPSSIAAAITCSGGMSAIYGTITNATSYVCTSGNINGNDAKNHDPVNNEFGGSGGGGGGVVSDSLLLGGGGSGSSGYLRIRWDESEQE